MLGAEIASWVSNNLTTPSPERVVQFRLGGWIRTRPKPKNSHLKGALGRLFAARRLSRNLLDGVIAADLHASRIGMTRAHSLNPLVFR